MKDSIRSGFGGGGLRAVLKGVFLLCVGWHSCPSAWAQQWQFENLETGFGGYTSIAVDSIDRPHVSYYYHNTGDLKYAVRTASVWSIQSVDTAGTTGYFSSLALDQSDRPRIAYRDQGGGRAVYAEHTGSTWTFSVIKASGQPQELDLVLDSTGKPHVSFYDLTDRTYYYATRSASWSLTSFGANRFYPAIALSPAGQPAVSADGPVVLNEFNGSTWGSTQVSSDAMDSQTSLKIASDGTVHLVYHAYSTNSVMYARRQNGVWSTEVIEAGINTAGRGLNAHSLALGPGGEPYVAYSNYANSQLRFAKRVGGVWSMEAFTPGLEPSLAVDSQGNPHIFYNAGGVGGLFQYAYRSSQGTTYSISGTITSGGSGLAGVTVTPSPSGTPTTTDASGDYTISGLNAGTYTVAPTKTGCTFTPASIGSITVGPNQTGKNFTATCGGAGAFYTQNMDTNPGWTISGGQWAFGHPTGSGGSAHGNPDPANGYTGTNVCGVNLSGDYSTAVGGPYYLTTTAINCTGYTGIHLQFRRWLNTDYSSFVAATVDASRNGSTWTSIYSNPSSAAVTDSSWQLIDYDISSVADGASTLYVRWGYQVKSGAYAYSGWNIDNVSLTGTSGCTPPPAPASFTHTANTTSSITWGWSDVTGEDGYRGHDASSVEKWTTLANIVSKQETGLSANTQYTRHVHAYASSCESTASSSASAYTSIEACTGVSFGTVAATSIQVGSTNTPSNLSVGSSGLKYRNITAGADSGWVQNGNYWASTSLVANTAYDFAARSRNGDAEETAETSPVTKWTLAVYPAATCNRSVGCPANPLNTAFTFTNTAVFDGGGVNHYHYAWDQSPTHTFSGSEMTWTSGALQRTASAAGAWYLHLLSHNGEHAASGTLDLGPYQVLDAPVLVTEPPTTPGNSNTITWNAVTGASDYYAECAANSSFSPVFANSGWITQTSYTFTGLTPGQAYWYRVKARTASGERTWSQTTQAEFDANTKTNVGTTAVPGDVVLDGGPGSATAITFEVYPGPDGVLGTSDDVPVSAPVLFVDQTQQLTNEYASVGVQFLPNPGVNDKNEILSNSSWGLRHGLYLLASASTGIEGTFSVPVRQLSVWTGTGDSTPTVLSAYDATGALLATSQAVNQGTVQLSVSTQSNIYRFTAARGNYGEGYDDLTFGPGGFVAFGTIVSTPVDLPAGDTWGMVTFTSTTPAGTTLIVDVLRASDNSLLLANISSGAELGGVTATVIKLRANLSTTDSSVTPALHDWSIRRSEPSEACETGWSNVESSQQCLTLTIQIQASPGETICEGMAATLDAGPGFAAYLWSPGAQTTQILAVTSAGTYSVTVTDANGCQGTDDITITVQTTVGPDLDHDCDVDKDDLAFLQGCASGPAIPLTSGCKGADLDGDGDVDQSDFGFYQRCYSGANRPADPNCANLVITPTITPSGGSFSSSVQVTLACVTTEATIRYTTDGSEPTTSSTVYTTPFTLITSATVKARAFLAGYSDSAVSTAIFTVTPAAIAPVIASIANGSHTAGSTYIGPTPSLTQGTTPVTWSLVTGPAGMAINASTGVVTWPTPTTTGSPFTVTIRATNAAGYGDETWSLIVTPTLAANAGADKTIQSGGSTTLDGSASGGTPPYTILLVPGHQPK